MILNTRNVTPLGVETSDVFSDEFNNNRRIYFNGDINTVLATEICVAINSLASKSKDDIWLIIIDSPGGSVSAGNAIIDTMKNCMCDICTLALGQASSMAAVLLSCGTRGKRYMGRNAQAMIHQVLGGTSGQTADVLRTADNMRKVNDKVLGLLAQNTGKSVDQIRIDCDRDFYLFAEEAIKYGLADEIFNGWK